MSLDLNVMSNSSHILPGVVSLEKPYQTLKFRFNRFTQKIESQKDKDIRNMFGIQLIAETSEEDR